MLGAKFKGASKSPVIKENILMHHLKIKINVKIHDEQGNTFLISKDQYY